MNRILNLFFIVSFIFIIAITQVNALTPSIQAKDTHMPYVIIVSGSTPALGGISLQLKVIGRDNQYQSEIPGNLFEQATKLVLNQTSEDIAQQTVSPTPEPTSAAYECPCKKKGN